MSTSEELKVLASQEENDLKAMGLLNKALRESRSEKFSDKNLIQLKEKGYEVIEDNGKYTIKTDVFGIVDFFPKANKLLIRKQNKWIKPGLKWLINNLMLL